MSMRGPGTKQAGICNSFPPESEGGYDRTNDQEPGQDQDLKKMFSGGFSEPYSL